MTQLNKTLQELHDEGIRIFPGTNPNATPQEIANEIMKSIREIASGNATPVDIE